MDSALSSIPSRNPFASSTGPAEREIPDLFRAGALRPELRAAWQHEYGDETYDIDASSANGGGGNFLVSGPEIGRDSLIFGAGVAVLFSETFSTNVYYDGEFFRDNYNRQGVSGGVRVAF